jgi:hypothetical protein
MSPGECGSPPAGTGVDRAVEIVKSNAPPCSVCPGLPIYSLPGSNVNAVGVRIHSEQIHDATGGAI